MPQSHAAASADAAISLPADAAEEMRAHDREVFLGSPRALRACAKEFDRLADDIARRVTSAAPALGDGLVEVRRTPGRCIVQLGPVALTVSWVRSRVDNAADGRLLIVEWEGSVARRAVLNAERVPALVGGPVPTVRREHVLMADATSETDWRWQREDGSGTGLPTDELAERCVGSLLAALEGRPATPPPQS